MNIAARSPRRRGGHGELEGQRRLAAAGRTEHENAGPVFDPAPEQLVEPFDAAFQLGLRPVGWLMIGGHQPGKNVQSASSDREVMVSATELAAT